MYELERKMTGENIRSRLHARSLFPPTPQLPTPAHPNCDVGKTAVTCTGADHPSGYVTSVPSGRVTVKVWPSNLAVQPGWCTV